MDGDETRGLERARLRPAAPPDPALSDEARATAGPADPTPAGGPPADPTPLASTPADPAPSAGTASEAAPAGPAASETTPAGRGASEAAPASPTPPAPPPATPADSAPSVDTGVAVPAAAPSEGAPTGADAEPGPPAISEPAVPDRPTAALGPAVPDRPGVTSESVAPALPTAAAEQAAAQARVRRHRLRYSRALRRIPAPRAAARGVAAWTRRPSGRLAVPGLLLALMVVTTGAAGAYLVPTTANRAAAPAPEPSRSAATQPPPDQSGLPSAPPTIGGGLGPTGSAIVTRPADALKPWAAQMSPRVGVPTVALEAYGYAELVVGRTAPGCGLTWTTLAAIGKVESDHGRANDAQLLTDGRALPAILGPPLNGTGSTMRIADTDDGLLDTDKTWDRAVGPMQFIPSTWEGHAIDADNDGMRDPSDIDDAALAAANYLCRGGRNLTEVGDWWAAILTYNDVQPYAQAVYQAANDYGARSRT